MPKLRLEATAGMGPEKSATSEGAQMPHRLRNDPEFRATVKLAIVAGLAIAVAAAGWLLWWLL